MGGHILGISKKYSTIHLENAAGVTLHLGLLRIEDFIQGSYWSFGGGNYRNCTVELFYWEFGG